MSPAADNLASGIRSLKRHTAGYRDRPGRIDVRLEAAAAERHGASRGGEMVGAAGAVKSAASVMLPAETR